MFGEVFWVAAGLFILLGIFAYFGVPKAIGVALDQRAVRIREELEEASHLRQEAEALLKEFTDKRNRAETEAKKIIDEAQKEAETLAKIAEEKLAAYITQKTEAAEQRIAQNEKEAIDDVRKAAADAAVKIAEQVLKQRFSNADMADQYLNKEISGLDKRLQ